MADYNDLLFTIKQIAKETVAAAKPCTVCTGKVVSISPLKIQVEQKLQLDMDNLILPEHLTDYDIELQLKGGSTKQIYTVYNSLKVDDVVILVRQAGGQKYLVVDRGAT